MARVSCRKAFSSKILEKAKENKNIYVIVTDSGGSVTINSFGDELPEQFIECGIAEQNAVGIAAGIAGTGKNVFVTGPACFLSARAYEQIKIDIAYNKSNVKIVGVSAGLSYGPLGGSHTSLHDYAGMRALANLTVLAPADDIQTEYVTDILADTKGPFYMRMGRGDVQSVYELGETFEIGKAKTVCDGNDITIIACGETVWHAKQAAELLQKHGICARVLDMFTIKPIDGQAILKAIDETHGIVTVEEHSIYGGLGEAVASIAAKEAKVPVRIIGLPDEEVIIGKSSELFEYYGLTAESIANTAMQLLGG